MSQGESFFIYDYESFGIDPAKDRPAQFGGIRTDSEWNIIGEPVMFYCQQSNDYLPSPEAVMVTGITPQQCNAEGIPEPEFAQRILHEFSQPNTCIMGYNNIRYDDEMTRYTFYRNFIDPYEYSWRNGNSRWDLLDVLRACYALRPEGINWVYDDNGLPIFKLDQLTVANGIEHSAAHDAMADVYATIEMAKLVKSKQPKLFQYFFELRNKRVVEKLIDTANMTPLVHISGMLGAYRNNMTLVAPIAWHPTNKNAVIVCDLTADITPLLTLSAEQLRERLYTSKTVLNEQGLSSIPLKLVHINKCPILAPEKVLLAKNAQKSGINKQDCYLNREKLLQSTTVRDVVTDVFIEPPHFENSDVETALYQGFFSDADKRNMQILRSLTPEQLKNPDLSFEDKRIAELLFLYRARHYPQTLDRSEQIRWKKYRLAKIEMQAVKFAESLERLALEYQNIPHKLELLQALYQYSVEISR